MRAVADAELGPEHLEGIEGADAQVAFERDLRSSIARVMGESASSAPAELRDRLQAMLGAGDAGQSNVVQTPMGDTRSRSFWSGIGRIAAIAAVVALCASAVIMSSRQPSSGHTLQAGLLASFVHNQHDRCQTDQHFSNQKFTATNLESAISLAREHLGEVPALIKRGFKNLEQIGFRFTGMGRCAVPGQGHSVHVLFRGDDAANRVVSLFIQVDRHQWVLADAQSAMVRDGLSGDQVVVVWHDDRFMYFLFASQNEDLAAFRRELGVPSVETQLIPAQ